MIWRALLHRKTYINYDNLNISNRHSQIKNPKYLPIFAVRKSVVYIKILMQMSHLTAEKKANIFKTYGENEKNTGSIEAQIAALTERINHISDHLKTNKKDFSSQRGLMAMVGRRKRLLQYLTRSNLASYRSLIEKLGLRK
jgi:small subunit ribosomal protein S15